MSEPKRYTFEAKEVLDANGMVCFVGVATMTHPMGKYVCYEDYARLKAEVERLTKAGDMCDQLLACFEMEGRRGVNIGRDMWREAKGVQL